MKAISYNGITFASLNVAAGIPADLPGPDVSPVLIERYGATPVHAGLGRGARAIPVIFTVKPGNTAEPTLMTLLAKLDPDDESERVLAADLNDGTHVYVNAAVGSYVYLAVNQLQVLFTASDSAWKKTTRRYSPGPDWTTYTAFTANGTLTVQNDGQTSAAPTVRLRWPGASYQRSTTTAEFGYRYRKTLTVTNNSTRTLRRYPIEVDLDDTTSLVPSKMRSDGNDIRIFCNGRELPRTLIGHNRNLASGTIASSGSTRRVLKVTGTPFATGVAAGDYVRFTGGSLRGQSGEIASVDSSSQLTLVAEDRLSAVPAAGDVFKVRNTTAWTVLDELRPGATATLEVVYGNPNADSPPTLASAPDMPAFDLIASSNATWRYKLGGTAKTPAATSGRGLWYADPVGGEAQRLSWDVPGAWQRLNYLDNRDDRTQLRVTRVNAAYSTTGTASTTTAINIGGSPGWVTDQWVGARFAITLSGTNYVRRVTANTGNQLTITPALPSAPGASVAVTLSTNVGRFDARRTWQDNAQYPEEGAYDGVMLAHPLGIISLTAGYDLTNPASIAKLVLVSRGSGAEDWAKDVEATATASAASIDLDWESGTYPVQIGLALSANDDVVIPTSYGKDSGTASSGSTTTIVDANKVWATDQWKDGKAKIVAGKGAKGGQRTVTGNSATTLTVSPAYAVTIDDTSRYIVTATHKASANLTGKFVVVTLQASLLTIGELSAEADVYDVGKGSGSSFLTLRMGGGSGAGQYPHHLVRLGGAGRRLFLGADAVLRIDAANRTVRLYDPTETTYVSVPWVADFYRVTAAGTLRSGEWLPVRAADSKLYVTQPNWGGSTLAVQVDLEEAFLG